MSKVEMFPIIDNGVFTRIKKPETLTLNDKFSKAENLLKVLSREIKGIQKLLKK